MESSLKLSYPAGPLRIFTTHAFDVLAYRGAYFGEAGLEYARQVTKNTEFRISGRSGWASAKFNDVYIGVNKSAFNLVGVEGAHLLFGAAHVFPAARPVQLHYRSEAARTVGPASIVNFGLAFGFTK